MAEEIKPNGDEETGGERLDRIERALNLMLDDHIQFREEHKLLLSAQVQMQGGLQTLRDQMRSLTDQVQTLAGQVGTIVSEFREFGHQVDTMRKNFDQRLKRIEG